MDMSSKTRIVVLHLKELIYTGIFAVLGILFLLLLIIMFLPGKSQTPADGEETDRFVPGKYTTSVILGNSSVDVEVVVDGNNINSIRLVNLDEAVTTMYPLMEPALNDLALQICEKQSLEDISYSEDNKYTSQVLLEAISSALEKAETTPGSSLESPRSRGGSSSGAAGSSSSGTTGNASSGTTGGSSSGTQGGSSSGGTQNGSSSDDSQSGSSSESGGLPQNQNTAGNPGSAETAAPETDASETDASETGNVG